VVAVETDVTTATFVRKCVSSEDDDGCNDVADVEVLGFTAVTGEVCYCSGEKCNTVEVGQVVEGESSSEDTTGEPGSANGAKSTKPPGSSGGDSDNDAGKGTGASAPGTSVRPAFWFALTGCLALTAAAAQFHCNQ